MLIRKMEARDVSGVARIEQENFSMPWSEKAFMDSLSQEEALFLVAEEEDRVLGYIGICLSFEEGEITNVSVDSSSRNKGVGSELVEQLKKEAQARGTEKIFLEVRVSNEPAIRLYEKQGFEQVGCRKNFYEKPREDAWVMMCDL
ncbi:MAG: ribosomal protein S18-alanine N-acetyltransferase [Agathobacter sp.]|nr:ribosomal protein S18-alanine N-acetyltransferase [Agathobacter sp.]